MSFASVDAPERALPRNSRRLACRDQNFLVRPLVGMLDASGEEAGRGGEIVELVAPGAVLLLRSAQCVLKSLERGRIDGLSRTAGSLRRK
jgi:hypothetical protein